MADLDRLNSSGNAVWQLLSSVSRHNTMQQTQMVTHEGADMTSVKKRRRFGLGTLEKWLILQRPGSGIMLTNEFFLAKFTSFFSVINCHFSKAQPLVLS